MVVLASTVSFYLFFLCMIGGTHSFFHSSSFTSFTSFTLPKRKNARYSNSSSKRLHHGLSLSTSTPTTTVVKLCKEEDNNEHQTTVHAQGHAQGHAAVVVDPMKKTNCRNLLASTAVLLSAFFFTPFDNSSAVAHAATTIEQQQEQQGISLITDSSLGKAVRKSTIQGAKIVDNLDEKWERFSDSLRDQNKCDENTGRRLFDNGFRRDGVTRIGNPVLGALCNPVALSPLNQDFGNVILDYAFSSAAQVTTATATTTTTDIMNAKVDSGNADFQRNMEKLQKSKDAVGSLVQPSFERSIAKIDEQNINERQRQQYNFAMYTSIKAMNDEFVSSSSPSSSFSNMAKQFYLSWGNTLTSNIAPNANRNDYSSPFPTMDDEFEDYDYNKNDLLDSLGILNVALKELQRNGLIGYFEISVPYDDYGSVVTVAVDDDITLGSQLLLREQGVRMNGSFVEALVRSVMEKANIKYTYDSFFIDPSTTKQNEYNPTQLLVSLSNLRIKD